MIRHLGPIAFCLFLFSSSILAYGQPAKFGQISRTNLKTESFIEDDDAAAVVIFDKGRIHMADSRKLTFDRHIRIKILETSAFDEFGSVELIYNKAEEQKISKLEAYTYNMGEGGKIVKSKVEKSNIFDQSLADELRIIKFTFPNLKPGSIVEYKYRMKWPFSGYLPNWVFQGTAYTMWSEYRVELPEYVGYRVLFQGEQDINADSLDTRDIVLGGSKERKKTFVEKNIPAFEDEPFMTSPSDHYRRLSLYVDKVVFGPFEISLRGSWLSLASFLQDDDLMGEEVERDSLVDIALADAFRDLDKRAMKKKKLLAIYDWVKSEISWNGEFFHLLGEDGIIKALENKEGNSAEVNYILLALLKKAGFDARSVFLSTRENGKVDESVPNISQFNYAIVRARIGRRPYLMDATDIHRPYDTLPIHALNGRAWVVSSDLTEWIDVIPEQGFRSSESIFASLDSLGTIRGSLSITEKEYAAIESRNLLDDVNKEEFLFDHLLTDWEKSEISNFDTVLRDSLIGPVFTSANFVKENVGFASNEYMYLDVVLLKKHAENPLKKDERFFPVNNISPIQSDYILNLSIPDGYEIVELPKEVLFEMSDEGGFVKRTVKSSDNRVVAHLTLDLKKDVYQAEKYSELKDLFDKLMEAQAEQIVLKKSLKLDE